MGVKVRQRLLQKMRRLYMAGFGIFSRVTRPHCTGAIYSPLVLDQRITLLNHPFYPEAIFIYTALLFLHPSGLPV